MDEDEDEETQEQPPFRWNPQAVCMLCLTMAAMAIPLMGVVWFVQGYLSSRQVAPKSAPQAEINTQPLRETLEHVADSQFAEETKVTIPTEEEVTIHLPAGEVTARVAQIEKLTKTAGGSILEMTSPDAAVRRFVIKVPSLRRDLLASAIRGEQVDFAAMPVTLETKLLEVKLITP
jgi:hypothetical protein